MSISKLDGYTCIDIELYIVSYITETMVAFKKCLLKTQYFWVQINNNALKLKSFHHIPLKDFSYGSYAFMDVGVFLTHHLVSCDIKTLFSALQMSLETFTM